MIGGRTSKLRVLSVAIGLAAWAAAMLPTLFGVWLEQPDRIYQGFAYNYTDHLVYQAWARQIRDGAWLATVPYGELEPGTRLTVLYPFLLGTAARWTGLSLARAQVVLQGALVAIALLVLGLFLRWWMDDEAAASYAFGLLATGSGLGWLAPGLRPIDLYDESQNLFFTFSTFPHQTLCAALFLAAIWALLLGARSGHDPRWALAAGLLLTADGLVHPYHYLELLLLGGLLFVTQCGKREAVYFAVFGATSLPHFLWSVHNFFTDRLLVEYRATVPTDAPGWAAIVVGLGLFALLFPVAAASARRFPERCRPAFWWAGAILFLVSGLLPIPVTRATLNFLQIPLVAVGAYWLVRIAPLDNWLRRGLVLAIAWMLCLPSSALQLQGQLATLRERPIPHYAPADWLAAMRVLDSLPREGTVLCSFPAGHLIAVHTRQVPVIGNRPWTPQYARRLADTEIFFSSRPVAERLEAARRNGVKLVFVEELLAGSTGYRAEADPLLEPVHRSGSAGVYRLR